MRYNIEILLNDNETYVFTKRIPKKDIDTYIEMLISSWKIENSGIIKVFIVRKTIDLPIITRKFYKEKL